ncbi:MAG TPA: NADH dehydrogenase subunit [Armatimonadetes bacterium]|nr:NADH dehydrogenase subunit [Armatimonadota bacterium]
MARAEEAGRTSPSLADAALAAGVVGAGGAGFPTHVKLGAQADTVIANGAECEPLMHKDTLLMERHAARVITGLVRSMEQVGASRGVIGIKAKRAAAIAALRAALPFEGRVELLLLGDYYPSGDEYELVHAATGRLIPPGGIPLAVGAVVHNVESLLWLADAAEGQPVRDKWLTVTGAVAQPRTFVAPVGTPFSALLEFCGGATVPDPVALVGGAMMGRLTNDFRQPVTKTTGGLIILDRAHPLIARKALPGDQQRRIGKSACDQCSYCTELCPRYLLGYDVQPHRVMRSLGFLSTGAEVQSRWGQLCCSCGICTLYSCPESLFPKEACDDAKAFLRAEGIRWEGTGRPLKPHAQHDARRLPIKRLTHKLGLEAYDVAAEYSDEQPAATRYVFPLGQHVGAPARAVVAVGEQVARGQVLGEAAEGALSARVHSSVAGRVAAVDTAVVVERD